MFSLQTIKIRRSESKVYVLEELLDVTSRIRGGFGLQHAEDVQDGIRVSPESDIIRHRDHHSSRHSNDKCQQIVQR